MDEIDHTESVYMSRLYRLDSFLHLITTISFFPSQSEFLIRIKHLGLSQSSRTMPHIRVNASRDRQSYPVRYLKTTFAFLRWLQCRYSVPSSEGYYGSTSRRAWLRPACHACSHVDTAINANPQGSLQGV